MTNTNTSQDNLRSELPEIVAGLPDDRIVYKTAASTQRNSRRRRAHLEDDCGHCPDNARPTTVRKLHQSDIICQYCRGYKPTGTSNEIYNQLLEADSFSDVDLGGT